MTEQIRILGERLLSSNWGTLKSYEIELKHRNGDWRRYHREVYDRGHAAAILLCDPARNVVTLVRQFRLPAYLSGEAGPLLEVCAGLLEGDTPEHCARKEAEEEAGIRPFKVRQVLDSFASPGSVNERIGLFVGEYNQSARVSDGGGLEAEGEDIEVVEMPFPEALRMVMDGEITDAKTQILLLHAALTGILKTET